MERYVTEDMIVAYMLTAAAHEGMRPDALKKSSVFIVNVLQIYSFSWKR
jgi:hypothetical protein